MADLSIIIPQFGKSSLTARCVETLSQHNGDDFQLLIVDDGSSSQDLNVLRGTVSRQADVLRLPRNRGVTYAWNRAAEVASCSRLLFLNNDTITSGPWCHSLLAELDNRDDRIVGGEFRTEPHLPSSIVPTLATRRLLSGWFLGMRRELFTDLGQFDERFRLYFSDTDLQCRLVQLTQSASCLVETRELPIVHAGHRTCRSLLSNRSIYRSDRLRFQEKWKPGRAGMVPTFTSPTI